MLDFHSCDIFKPCLEKKKQKKTTTTTTSPKTPKKLNNWKN